METYLFLHSHGKTLFEIPHSNAGLVDRQHGLSFLCSSLEEFLQLRLDHRATGTTKETQPADLIQVTGD